MIRCHILLYSLSYDIFTFSYQLQTTHVEISTDEPSTDSTVVKSTSDEIDNKKWTVCNGKNKSKKADNKCTYCSKSFKKASDLVSKIKRKLIDASNCYLIHLVK